MNKNTFLLVSGLLTLLSCNNTVQARTYIFSDLGRDSDISSSANAINSAGMVVGSIMFSSNGTPRQRAFSYDKGVRNFDFYSGSPNMSSSILGINDIGCAVGWTQANDLAPIYLSVWKVADTCPFNDSTYISTDLGGSNTSGAAINNNNQVVGYSETSSGDSHAFSMTLGNVVATDLGVLAGGWNSAAFSINDKGIAAGYSTSASAVQSATRWDAGKPPVDIGAFPGASSGTQSYALAINNQPNPQIAGWSYGPNNVSHPHAFVWQRGVMTDLGTLPGGSHSEALDINEHGVTVGWSTDGSFHVHAVFWQNGSILDLNSVDGIPDGWILSEARGVNDLGQIVGKGVFQGKDRAFLITPIEAVPEVFRDGFETGDTSMWTYSVP